MFLLPKDAKSDEKHSQKKKKNHRFCKQKVLQTVAEFVGKFFDCACTLC